MRGCACRTTGGPSRSTWPRPPPCACSNGPVAGTAAPSPLETIVAAAAHDIRSPLTAMKGFGYALEKRWVSMTEEQRALMLRGIVYDADRMDAIVRLLVDAGRVAVGLPRAVPRARRSLGARARHHRVGPPRPRAPRGPLGGGGRRRRHGPGSRQERHPVVHRGPGLVGPRGSDHDRGQAGGRPAAPHRLARRDGAHPEDAEGLFEARRPGTGAGSKIGLYVARGVAETQGGRAWADVTDGRLSFHLETPLLPRAEQGRLLDSAA